MYSAKYCEFPLNTFAKAFVLGLMNFKNAFGRTTPGDAKLVRQGEVLCEPSAVVHLDRVLSQVRRDPGALMQSLAFNSD